jgi:quercetin dioxygenase-like cupin family protein
MNRRSITSTAGTLLLLASALLVHAQAPSLTTKVLLRTTFADDATKEALVVSAEVAPLASTGRHTHPGDEYGTVLEGTLEVHVDGKKPRVIHAGESYHNRKDVVHEARNPTQSKTRLLSTFIIEKGQPVIRPVK